MILGDEGTGHLQVVQPVFVLNLALGIVVKRLIAIAVADAD